MSMRLGELVQHLGGELIGDAEREVFAVAPIDTADSRHITFLSNPRLMSQAAQTKAAALIVSAAHHQKIGQEYQGAIILTDNPYAYFARAAQRFAAQHAIAPAPGVHPSAVVDSAAIVAATATVGPHVVIESGAVVGERCVVGSGTFIGRNARVGDDTLLYPRVVLQERCVIGKRGIVHSGAVIGADGFGFAQDKGVWIKIPQTGAVRIGDDVEIGANTTIDRGALADTVIEDDVKLDNQIQIGHNCHIGAHTAMAGCVGVAGSARIGRHCTIGGAAMIHGHITIADKVHVSAGTLVMRSIDKPGQYTGFYPMTDHANWEKSAVLVRNLGAMREKIRNLEKSLQSLVDRNNEQP